MTDTPLWQYVRVKRLRALPLTDLGPLGQVNVLCGRNNSGKSTILEALANPNLHERAIVFDAVLTETVAESLMAYVDLKNKPGSFGHQLRDIFRSQLQSKNSILFPSDVDEFVGQLANRFGHNPLLGQVHKNIGGMTQALRALFPQTEVSTMLPPQRRLELTKQVNAADTVMPDGQGILNALFFARSQPTNSPANHVLLEVHRAFERISDGFQFEVFLSDSNQLSLEFAREGGDWIPSENCGLGLRDLVVMLYYAHSPGSPVLLIEEPESHLHPQIQRALLRHLTEETTKQYVFSTHSNVFLDDTLVDQIFFTECEKEISVDNATSRASILNDLGYSVADNLCADLLILGEGPTDRGVIEEFLIKMGLWDKYVVRYWPLGGDIMDQLDLGVFREKYNVIAVVDNDPGSKRVRERFLRACEENGIEAMRLKRRAIENYFSVNALRTVFKGQVPVTLTAVDPRMDLLKQLGFNVKARNRQVAHAMSLDDIKGTDFRAFLDRVAQLCETGHAKQPAVAEK
jgi:ABC-type polar amino acid transport system ATPase subunit